jgi:uncharacterized damage-inducible protein DinB
MTEIENIISLLTSTFEKNAWHGPSVKETLNGVTSALSQRRFENTHSIIELVAHMTAWRNFVIQKLKGDETYRVDDEKNFPVATDWLQTVANLDESQAQLIQALENFPVSKLFELVPHKAYRYNFYFLLHGIIHHDLYHIGQIALIKKSFS